MASGMCVPPLTPFFILLSFSLLLGNLPFASACTSIIACRLLPSSNKRTCSSGSLLLRPALLALPSLPPTSSRNSGSIVLRSLTLLMAPPLLGRLLRSCGPSGIATPPSSILFLHHSPLTLPLHFLGSKRRIQNS